MEYSLQTLNNIANLKDIKLTDLINRLNLIGLEVDNIKQEKLVTNHFLNEIILLIKIPADRDDLLNNKFFLNELAFLLSFSFYRFWDISKLKYFSVIQNKFKNYSNYANINIDSDITNVFLYLIEIKDIQKVNSPLWLLKKLEGVEIKNSNNFHNILNLISQEWGQNYSVFSLPAKTNNPSFLFQLEYSKKLEEVFDNEKNTICSIPNNSLILKNKETNEIVNIVSKKELISEESLQKKEFRFFLQTLFYSQDKTNSFVNLYNKDIRKVFLENFKISFQRLLTLLEILTSSTIIPQVYSIKGIKIELKTEKILNVKKKKLYQILNLKNYNLEFFKLSGIKLICETKTNFYFQISSLRRDLIREIDLIEEYSKFVGYQNFKEIIPKKEKKTSIKKTNGNEFIKTFFLNYNFSEIVTNPINEPQKNTTVSIKIENPLNIELSVLRTSLLPKLLDTFEKNFQNSERKTNFFEIGRIFKQIEEKLIEEEKLSGVFQILPSQSESISEKNSIQWFIQRGFIEAFLYNFNYKNLNFYRIDKNINFFHPTRSVLIFDGYKFLGIFGQINPTLEKLNLIKDSLYGFELNLQYFKQWKLNKKIYSFTEYSKYPIITRDISVNINKNSNLNKLKSSIYLKSKFLKNVSIFDIYFDRKLLDTVNIGIRLEFQSKMETLLNERIEKEMDLIMNFLLIDTVSNLTSKK